MNKGLGRVGSNDCKGTGMPRPFRVEYPGAIDHLMSRGDHREAIFRDDVDHRAFIKTLGEASRISRPKERLVDCEDWPIFRAEIRDSPKLSVFPRACCRNSPREEMHCERFGILAASGPTKPRQTSAAEALNNVLAKIEEFASADAWPVMTHKALKSNPSEGQALPVPDYGREMALPCPRPRSSGRNRSRPHPFDTSVWRCGPRRGSRNRVAIPTHFYKIIFKKKTLGVSESIAILLPHDDANGPRSRERERVVEDRVRAVGLKTLFTGDAWINYVTSHITTIGEIQRVTGIDFVPGVTGAKRIAMENFKAPTRWPKEWRCHALNTQPSTHFRVTESKATALENFKAPTLWPKE
jgi:hypothetical protein